MTEVSVSQEVVLVTVSPQGQPAVTLTVPSPPQVVVQPLGAQGPPGPPPTPGPGFVLVGAELRLSISTLPQG